MWARLARYDAIIDAQPTEKPDRQQLILRWIELGYVRGAAIEEGNKEYAILKAKWELAEALRNARDAATSETNDGNGGDEGKG